MRVLSVSEFLKGTNDVLASVPALVEGELSGFALRQERWAFFSLKDEESVVECFMPAWKIRHEVADGMLVRVAGVPQVYAKSGRFRIVAEALEPVGEGSLKRAFELLKQKLEREGLFAPERKRELPRFPETIGLITSKESAAYTDFIRILRNRWGGVRMVVQDVAVLGERAVGEIVEAFRYWSNVNGQVSGVRPDLLVLIRGGGSLEDLQAFNSEDVARAFFASSIPVVVGVGHERDTSIADLVADVRASTPSNAAERVVPDRRDVANELQALVEQTTMRLGMLVRERRSTMDRFLLRGGAFAQRRRLWIDARSTAMQSRMVALHEQLVARMEHAVRTTRNLNPVRLLERGYSMTRIRGTLVRAARAVRPGDTLDTTFSDGEVSSVVT
ncbi:exodeoxyribonuclease VII large subunit [Candidatus Uhrbacteria bacterium]|nr:exodeoxyribonuclease VII large subunit [Candidatus Uhrbacteria bacterium]